jgi:hypothetical protein
MGKSQPSAPQIMYPDYDDPYETLSPTIDALQQQMLEMQQMLLAGPETPELDELEDVDEIDWTDVQQKLTAEEIAKLEEEKKKKLGQKDLVVADDDEEEPDLLQG